MKRGGTHGTRHFLLGDEARMGAEARPCNHVRSLCRCDANEAGKKRALMKSIAILLMLICAVCLSVGAGDGSGPGGR